MDFKINTITSILLYTDGIIDQQGGEKQKKLYTSGIKKWFENPGSENYYKHTLDKFKGSGSQRDDILLINLKLKQ